MFRLKLITFCTLVAACTSTGDKLENFERKEVKRSYTMPYGMKAWTPYLSGSILDKEVEDESDSFFVNPLSFTQPITDKFSLDWTPLPLSFTYAFLDTEEHKLAANFNYFLLGSTYFLKYKYLVTDFFAVEPSFIGHDIDWFFFEEEKKLYSLNFIFQISKNWSLGARYGIGSVEGDSDFIRIIFKGTTGSSIDSSYSYKITEFSLTSHWQLSQAWDMRFEASQYSLKDYDSKSPMYLELGFIHYWDKKLPKQKDTVPEKEENTSSKTEEVSL